MFERGRDCPHNSGVGASPALDRELGEHGRETALGNGVDNRSDTGRRGGTVGEPPDRLLPEKEIVASGEATQGCVIVAACEPRQGAYRQPSSEMVA